MKCQIGVSLYPDDGQDIDSLTKAANIARERSVEHADAHNCCFYSLDKGEAARQQVMIETGIRDALANDSFSLHCQPIIDVRTGAVNAAEALLRCNEPALKDASVDMLIGIAQEAGLIGSLGEMVFDKAMAYMEAWDREGCGLPSLSINLSPRQIDNEETGQNLLTRVLESKCDLTRIQFEVTETSNFRDFEVARQTLQRLQRLGARVALDDFGTGQSSLSYVQKLNPDTIKIDRAFVEDMEKSSANEEIVKAIISMSKALGIAIVAEGVETQKQAEMLTALGCNALQGYLFAPPVGADVFTDWLKLFRQGKTEDPAEQPLTGT